MRSQRSIGLATISPSLGVLQKLGLIQHRVTREGTTLVKLHSECAAISEAALELRQMATVEFIQAHLPTLKVQTVKYNPEGF